MAFLTKLKIFLFSHQSSSRIKETNVGYCIDQIDDDFFIPSDKFDDVLKAIRSLNGQQTCESYVNGVHTPTHFSWVDYDFWKKDSLDETLRAWRWTPEVVVGGNKDIVGLQFDGEKLGDEDILFTAIAPFVEDGSSITVQGEDGFVWSWVFENGKVRRVYE